jgi:hypothetical protein
MRADVDRCVGPDEGGGVEAVAALGISLRPDGVGEALAEARAGDLVVETAFCPAATSARIRATRSGVKLMFSFMRTSCSASRSGARGRVWVRPEG